MIENKMVSIILPNYNGSKYISESIESVLKQTYTNWELIIVDDGSTDNSKDIIDSYKDKRIKKIYLKENNHICFALNEGLKKISGEYVARIDSDDIWKSDKLEKQVDFMEKNSKFGACFTYVDLIDENTCIVNEKYDDLYNWFRCKISTQKEFIHFFIYEGNCLSHPSVLLRKCVIEDVGAYNLAYVQGQDYELWLRIALKYEIYVYPESLVLYRWDIGSEDKVSKSTEENDTRFQNEFFLAVYKFMMNISQEDFVKYFKEDFICKDAKTDLELQCEKAFLCLKENGMGRLYLIGIILLEDIINQKDGMKVLREKYKFTLKDFYKLNQEHILNDYVLKNKMNSMAQEIEFQKQLLNKEVEKAVQVTRTSYENSFSWRITAPIRKIGKIRKNIREKKSGRFFLIGTEDYGNLGDHKIAMTEIAFIQKYFPHKEIIEISARQYFEKKDSLLEEIQKNDIILGHGGGNLGNQYLASEMIRRDFIKAFPHNRIIIFPQTIYFTSNELGEKEKKITQNIYNSHQNLTVCVRDKTSYRKAKEMFKCAVQLVPDIVLWNKYLGNKEKRKNQILLCFREDIERVVSLEQKKIIEKMAGQICDSIVYEDTQKAFWIDTSDRGQYVEEFFDVLSKSKLMVTDRMHGMIFAAISGTPCIAIDNYNGKILGAYEWIKELPYIYYASDVNDVVEHLAKMYDLEDKYIYKNDFLLPYYNKLLGIINGE